MVKIINLKDLMSQIRSISSKRFIRYVGELNAYDFEKVRQIYLSFI